VDNTTLSYFATLRSASRAIAEPRACALVDCCAADSASGLMGRGFDIAALWSGMRFMLDVVWVWVWCGNVN